MDIQFENFGSFELISTQSDSFLSFHILPVLFLSFFWGGGSPLYISALGRPSVSPSGAPEAVGDHAAGVRPFEIWPPASRPTPV